jgi:flavorubredoxin
MIAKITDDIYYIGQNDRRLSRFENLFPIPDGVSYNSYLIVDDKTVLLDTVDAGTEIPFIDDLTAALDGRSLDYLVVNHMEPDHCASLNEVVKLYPEVKIIGNAKTFSLIKQFFPKLNVNEMSVKEFDTLETGRHILTFVMAPMVHWPEVMVTYDKSTGALFSADAFGMFGALSGNLFLDDAGFDQYKEDEARRYYSNIVGKYGNQVQMLLKKASGLDIKMICSLHGPILRGKQIAVLISKYDLWSRYEPETDDYLIVYASMYGHTKTAAEKIATILAEKGKKTHVADVCSTDKSYLISEMFKDRNIILASVTYNMGLYPQMEALVLDMKALALKKRNVGIVENGSWAPAAGQKMAEILCTMQEINVKANLTIKSALNDSKADELEAFIFNMIQ